MMIQAMIERPSTDSTMPKKKSTNPRLAGVANMGVTEIQDLVAQCRFELAEIDQLVLRIRDIGVDSLTVNGATQLKRGMELLQQFSGHLYNGFKDAAGKKRAE